MAADASIYSMIRPPTAAPGPLEQYGQAMSLKNLMGQGELHALQLEGAKRDFAAQDKLRSLFAGGTEPTEAQVMAIDPKTGMSFAKNRLDASKTKAELDKLNIERFSAGAKALRDVIASATSDADMPRIRDAAVQIYGPDKAAQMQIPDRFDPAWQLSHVQTGDKLLEQLEKAKDRNLKAANEPFTPGPSGPVANQPVQDFLLEKAKKGATNVQVKTDVKMGESLAGQVGPMMKDSTSIAEGAVKQADAAQRIVKAVDTGKIITGPAADQRLILSQVGQVLGIGGKDEAEKIANTRATLRGLAELTLQGRQQMKGQGAITESEGKLAEKAMSGDISLTAAEIKQLAQASERAARFNYKEHNRKLKVMQDNPNLNQLAPFYQGPAMPAEMAPAQPGQAGGIKFLGYEDKP